MSDRREDRTMSDYRKDRRMQKQSSGRRKNMTFRRILAWIAIILLAGMYVLTLIFSLIDSPLARQLFHASLYCTVFIPVISWVFLMVVKLVKGQGNDREENQD